MLRGAGEVGVIILGGARASDVSREEAESPDAPESVPAESPGEPVSSPSRLTGSGVGSGPAGKMQNDSFPLHFLKEI
ncbi:hypothetical protein AAFF_G00304820 [Aldrovandia affinis]|uniref:Uncharacterized protein n=1 Tax=Aldrovandia affinis TaxID=143900 RepID=A0AAD7SR61_9TELE|nr:hypothetical protein AAFF_G00304820 [Aldrovandia affinis]